MASDTANLAQQQWHIVGRWQEYEGEARANLLRVVAIGSFYLVEVLRFHALERGAGEEWLFHRQATAIAVAWTLLTLAVMLCLRRRLFPAALKFVSTAGDILLLTTLASLAAGPFSVLVLGYFLVVALAALRFSVRLVWFAAGASMLGYWLLVGLEDLKTSRWFDAQHAVAPVTQLLTLLSLALTGVIIGQVVRRAEGLACEYAQRLAAAKGPV